MKNGHPGPDGSVQRCFGDLVGHGVHEVSGHGVGDDVAEEIPVYDHAGGLGGGHVVTTRMCAPGCSSTSA